jgi:hypothetical protein
VKFKSPMAVTMKISVLWDVAPCSLVDCNSSALMMGTSHSSETSIIIFLAVRRHIPEDSELQHKFLETSSCNKEFLLALQHRVSFESGVGEQPAKQQRKTLLEP